MYVCFIALGSPLELKFKEILGQKKGYVVAHVQSAHEVISLKQDHPCDIIFLDSGMAKQHEARTIFTLKEKFPTALIILLFKTPDVHFAQVAIQAGVNGCMLLKDHADILDWALDKMYNGGIFISPELSESVINIIQNSEEVKQKAYAQQIAFQYTLNQREQQIAYLLLNEKNTYLIIAETLFLSINTIRSHVRTLYRKLDIHSRKDLVQLYKANF